MKNYSTFRSSRQDLFSKKCVLRNFAKFIEKHLCQSLFFNKVAGLRPETLLKNRLWHKCFPVYFVKFLRIPFLQNIPTDFKYSLLCNLNRCTCIQDPRKYLRWRALQY